MLVATQKPWMYADMEDIDIKHYNIHTLPATLLLSKTKDNVIDRVDSDDVAEIQKLLEKADQLN